MEIRRKVKNVVYKYSEAERLVREATSNDPWGPSTTVMSEISDMTHNHHAFNDIMQLIWKRLNDKGKNWRHVYKSLVLLDYLIKCGDDRVSMECLNNIHTIQTLKDFQYFEEHKDLGLGVREKSKALVNLLKDKELLENEKVKGKKVKAKFHKPNSSLGSHQLRRPGELGKEIRRQAMKDTNRHRSVIQLNFDSKEQESYDEDLQRAIELSKQEHETAMQRRKEEEAREELKLKMALEQSKKEEEAISTLKPPPKMNSKGKRESLKTGESDLFDISQPKSESSVNKTDIAKLAEASRVFDSVNGAKLDMLQDNDSSDPWGSGRASSNQAKIGTKTEVSLGGAELDFDPWSTVSSKPSDNHQPATSGFNGMVPISHDDDDPWGGISGFNKLEKNSDTLGNTNKRNIVNDIFGDDKPDVNFDSGVSPVDGFIDPWSSSINGPKIKEPRNVNTGSLASLNDVGEYEEKKIPHSLSVIDLSEKKQITPQEFLGENANLVNFDNLVPVPKAGFKNPFGVSSAAVATTTINPFDSQAAANAMVNKVPMNQMAMNNNSSGPVFSSSIGNLNQPSSMGAGFMVQPVTIFPNSQSQYQGFTTQPINNNFSNNNNSNNNNNTFGSGPWMPQGAVASSGQQNPLASVNPWGTTDVSGTNENSSLSQPNPFF